MVSFEVAAVLVRGIAKSFDKCERENRTRPIDVGIAERQHLHYTNLLANYVGRVQTIAPDNGFPDCVFLEDCIVILNSELAILTRPGDTSRGTAGKIRHSADQVG